MTRTILLLFSACVVASATSAQAQTVAYTGVRLLDGKGAVHEPGVLIVRDGRVVAAGPADGTPVPDGAARVDLAGKTVIPGLVNAHGHVAATTGLRSDPAAYTRANLVRQLRTYAQYGVTTVFSLGDDQAAGFALRDESRRGASVDRARLFVSGPVIYETTAEAARRATDRAADLGPDVLKIRVDDNLGTSRKMPEEAWRATMAQAEARGLPVAVHIFYLADAKAVLAAGADFIAHSVRDVPVDDAFARMLKARDVCYCPTLTREISTFIYDETPAWVDDPFFLKGAEPGVATELADPSRHARIRQSAAWTLGQQYKVGLEVAKRNLARLSSQGVRIAFGTDSGPPARFQGFFEHLELEMMVEAGLSPMQALVAATGDAARCHGKAGELGTLESGAVADFVVLGANPLDDIRHLRRIESVWIAGRQVF